MPLGEPASPPGSMLAPPAGARRQNRGLALLGGLSRLTFNLVLLGIIIAILAIPISIALARLASQPPANVSTLPTPTPRPIPTPYPGYKSFQSGALVMSYPAAWKHGPFAATLDVAGGVQGDLFAQSDTVSLAVATTGAIPANQLQSILDAGLLHVTQGRTDSFNPLVTPQLGPTLDGVRFWSEEYTFNLVNAQQTTRMHAVALVANRGAYTYISVYEAPDSQFAGLRSQYFAPMVSSFRFRP